MLVLSGVLLPAMIVGSIQGGSRLLYIDLPLFMASFCSVSSFYVVSQRGSTPRLGSGRFSLFPS